jgi:hypothetical protein
MSNHRPTKFQHSPAFHAPGVWGVSVRLTRGTRRTHVSQEDGQRTVSENADTDDGPLTVTDGPKDQAPTGNATVVGSPARALVRHGLGSTQTSLGSIIHVCAI